MRVRRQEQAFALGAGARDQLVDEARTARSTACEAGLAHVQAQVGGHLGVTEAMTVTLASSALQELVGMVLFLLVLFFMPNGLFGARATARLRAMAMNATFPPHPARARRRRRALGLSAATATSWA